MCTPRDLSQSALRFSLIGNLVLVETSRAGAPFHRTAGAARRTVPPGAPRRPRGTAPSWGHTTRLTHADAPVLPSVTRKRGCVAFSAAGRASVWSTVNKPRALLPF